MRSEVRCPTRSWWKRKRWIAAGVLWLVLAYVAGLGPLGYAVGRGWILGPVGEAYAAPLSLLLGQPSETAIGREIRGYAQWWVELGRQ